MGISSGGGSGRINSICGEPSCSVPGGASPGMGATGGSTTATRSGRGKKTGRVGTGWNRDRDWRLPTSGGGATAWRPCLQETKVRKNGGRTILPSDTSPVSSGGLQNSPSGMENSSDLSAPDPFSPTGCQLARSNSAERHPRQMGNRQYATAMTAGL